MAGFSAKNARVQINGTNFTANKWMVNIKTDELDITNFETTAANNIYADYTSGVMEAEVSVELIYDVLVDPFSGAPSITPGTILTNLILFMDRINFAGVNGRFLFPSFQVFNCSVDAETRGIVKYSFVGKNKGIFKVPGAA